jgi:hypothetical protein
MMRRCLAVLALAPIIGIQISAQSGPGVQQPPYKNDLLDNFVGLWTLSGMSGGRAVRGGADAEWVLNHLFLRLHQKEVDGPEFVLHIGYDTYDQRLVAIRLDSISARGAETNGYGLQDGNSIKFTYDYPTVQFRQTWTWDPAAKSWQFLVETKDRKANTWRTTSNMTLRRFQGGRRGPGAERPLPQQPPPAPQQPPPAPQQPQAPPQ